MSRQASNQARARQMHAHTHIYLSTHFTIPVLSSSSPSATLIHLTPLLFLSPWPPLPSSLPLVATDALFAGELQQLCSSEPLPQHQLTPFPAAAVAFVENELYSGIVGGVRSSGAIGVINSACCIVALLFPHPSAPCFRPVAFSTLPPPAVFCTGVRAILRARKQLVVGVRGQQFRGFCADFVEAMRGRGGGGEEFVSAAALWIGLKESRSGDNDVRDIAVELATCGDVRGYMACLTWLQCRTAGACGAKVKALADGYAHAFATGSLRDLHVMLFYVDACELHPMLTAESMTAI